MWMLIILLAADVAYIPGFRSAEQCAAVQAQLLEQANAAGIVAAITCGEHS